MDATWEVLDGVTLLRCFRCGCPLALLSHRPGSSPSEREEDWETHLGDVAALAREHHCRGRRGTDDAT